MWRHKACLTGLINQLDRLTIRSKFIWPSSITQRGVMHNYPLGNLIKLILTALATDEDPCGNMKIPLLQAVPDVLNFVVYVRLLYFL